MSRVEARFEILKMPGGTVKETIHVQYNPTDLNFAKNAQLAEIAIPGLDSPVIQFIRGGAETLSLELFFDTTDSGMNSGTTSVTTMTENIYKLVKQDPDSHAPPVCRFKWGSPSGPDSISAPVSSAPFWFTGVVESIDRKFVLFAPDGTPLRARLTIKMREYRTVDQMVAKLNSADHTKSHVVKRRERLDQLSSDEYSSPDEWRRIADENELDDPRRLVAGTQLRIPPIRVGTAKRRED